MLNNARRLTMVGVAVVLTISGSTGASARRPADPQPSNRQPAGPQVRRAPTESERARLMELAARDKAWAAAAAADLMKTAEGERARLFERRSATLKERNERTRAELARRLRAADSPAARAEARRVEIQEEAADLIRRSETASGSEQLEIERRAEQLAAELRRLPR
jgi:hypothetical protein